MESHGTLTITKAATVDNVLGPGTAFDTDHFINGQLFELYSDQRTQIVLLILVGIVVGGETLRGIVFDGAKGFDVLGIVAIAGDPDLLTLQNEKKANEHANTLV